MRIRISHNHIDVSRVAHHDVIEKFQAELGKVDCPTTHLFNFNALLFSDAFGHSARDRGAGMDLATADHFDHRVPVFARLDHLPADFQSNLVDNAQNVAFSHRPIRSNDKIWTTKSVEMGGVVGEVKSAVKQFAQLLGRRGDGHVVDCVSRLGCCHVVCFRAYAADAVHQQRHLFHRSAHAEALKTAQFRNLEVGIRNFAVFIQEDLDLAVAFQPCNRIYRDTLFHLSSYCPFQACLPDRSKDLARLNR